MTLSERLSSAGVEQQRELLIEVYAALDDGRPLKQDDVDRYGRFVRMLDAEAYLDAAVMLVPEGWVCERLHWWPGSDQPAGCSLLGTHEFRGQRWHNAADGRSVATAATPALALCAAIAKERGL